MNVANANVKVNSKSRESLDSERISTSAGAVRLANKVAHFAERERTGRDITLTYDSLAGSWPAPFERGNLSFTVIDRNGREERRGLSEHGWAVLKILYSRAGVASQLPRVFNVRQTNTVKPKSRKQ